jgi:hypothetical protein
MVSLGNALLKHAGHKVSFLHMPVPIERNDDAFFAPFRDLALPDGCQLFLGLLHLADGVQGSLKRAHAAKKVVSGFGIATECGLGRAKTASEVNRLIDLHAEVARQLAT